MRYRLLPILLAASLVAAACGSPTDDDASTTSGADTTAAAEAAAPGAPGIRVVSPAEGAAIQADPPDDLVILDVRTSEEFAEGHLEGATMIDFYRDDFAEQLAELDPDRPYLIYCRSGNRSGQTRAIMDELGFTDVADVDGGIIAWTGAGLDITQ